VRWLSLLAVPDVLGSSGSFGLPSFLPSYNLTEVTGYVGVLPLAAALGLLAFWRLRRPPDYWIWHVLALVGILLALGGNTPLGHVLSRLPLYGAQRLQSRNIAVTDLALCVLLAVFVDYWLAVAPGDRRHWRERALRVCGACGALVPTAVAAVALLGGTGGRVALGLSVHSATTARALAPGLVAFALLGVCAAALVLARRRLRRPARPLIALVGADLVAFLLLTVIALAPGLGVPVQRHTGARRDGATIAQPQGPLRPLAALHLRGRFAIYDPTLADPGALAALGAPDVNVEHGVPSVLGYGSLVSGTYAAATGVHGLMGHGQDTFSPAAARNGVLDALETTTVLAPESAFLLPAPAGSSAESNAALLRPGHAEVLALGAPEQLRSLRLSTTALAAAPAARVTAVLVSPGGSAQRVGSVRAGTTRTLPLPRSRSGPSRSDLGASVPVRRAVTLVLRASGGPVRVVPPLLGLADGATAVPSGPLASALAPPHWRLTASDGPFVLFHDTRAAPALRLLAGAGETLAGAHVRALSGPAVAPTRMAVSSRRGVVLVRSESAIAGWRALWQPRRGAPELLPVRAHGLVQQVAVPAGRGTLAFSYVAPDFALGLALCGVGLVALGAFLLPGSRRRRPAMRAGRRRRRSGRRLSASPARPWHRGPGRRSDAPRCG
jgi:hypothetical protein